MSEKKHELYLIALALVISAGLILYIAFDTPGMNAVKISQGTTAAQTLDLDDIIDYYQSETAKATDTNKGKTAISNTATAASDETEAASTAVSKNSNGDTAAVSGKVNINTASKEQLMTLDGIGEVKAAAIIEYRRENGNFRSINDLDKIKGIGEKTIEKLKIYITV